MDLSGLLPSLTRGVRWPEQSTLNYLLQGPLRRREPEPLCGEREGFAVALDEILVLEDGECGEERELLHVQGLLEPADGRFFNGGKIEIDEFSITRFEFGGHLIDCDCGRLLSECWAHLAT